ncbi:MAG: hypothetical protein CW716_01440 [Candidatus Bathyarchaeum sp.]|nr:MAG: hypothetical protein CW716_01440 [Candidatus Bathyarchaeum sp.]
MPRGDKTGPSGAGPMTGRATGYCAGYSIPGYMNPTGGYGRTRSRARGRGWGRGFGRRGRIAYQQPVIVQPVVQPQHKPPIQQTPEQEIVALENYQKELQLEKKDLDEEMGGVTARIEELKEKLQKPKNEP